MLKAGVWLRRWEIEVPAPAPRRTTTEDYLAHLEMSYLVRLLPAWSRNLTCKITRHPEVHITDTGVGAHLLGRTPEALARPTDPVRGHSVTTSIGMQPRAMPTRY